MRRLFAVALVAAVMGICAASAHAAGYRLLNFDGGLVKWGEPGFGEGADVTYALADHPMSFPDAVNCRAIRPMNRVLARSALSLRDFKRELSAAFAAWERVADIRFRRVDDPETANLVIGSQTRPRGRAYANVAYKPAAVGSDIRAISKSLICLNPEHRWKIGFDGDDTVYDLRFTLMHEIGHAIGLDHEGSHDQLMGFAYHENFREPQAGDIAGASALYGPAPGAPRIADSERRDDRDRAARPRHPFLSLGQEHAPRAAR